MEGFINPKFGLNENINRRNKCKHGQKKKTWATVL